MTLTDDAVLCLALYVALKYSEIVPLYDDFRSKAPLIFSEHTANAVSCSTTSLCLMTGQVPLSRCQGGGVRNGKFFLIASQVCKGAGLPSKQNFFFLSSVDILLRAKRFNIF